MISIRVAKYGKPPENGCPSVNTKESEESKNCKRPNAMQFSLLQTVLEECQKKPQCKFSTVPKPGLIDPCPTHSKYVEVTYKCRPYEFRSRNICEGERIKLSCNPHSRIAIFDAQYGRTKFEATRCPQPPGVPDETCAAPHAVKTVIQQCLGKRRCQIVAHNRIFNSSCQIESKAYLKVVYACVPLGVLSEKFESAVERDEISGTFNLNGGFFEDSEEEGDRYREPNADHALLSPLDDIAPSTHDHREESTTHDIDTTIKENERIPDPQRHNSALFLYTGIGILIFIIIVAIFIGVRCYISRKLTENSKNGDMYTTEAPNVFNDAFSDIDNDADISHISGTFHDPLHPDMILYKNIPGSRGTLRAMKPLCTIYPSPIEANMYGNVDFVPSHTRDQVVAPRFTRSRSNEEEVEPNVMTSPRSLGAPSSNYYYG
ncbi:unnamed protein product [Arctia plantaginis]|uniref:SUEL-type lectin domain-containing protein n=1 Tax=Arctia plantaginis TaxID=874455 RepID=A0A8S0YWJ0_ARCPL|nr:unnamed protein product [Arctia plantaginis]